MRVQVASVAGVEQTTGESPDRLIGIDLARSLALLGMCVIHFVLVAGTPQNEAGDAFAGRPAVVFVVLAGVGVALFTRRVVESGDPARLRAARLTLTRRGQFLLALGFLNLLVWPGDILRVYGVTLVVVAGLVGRRSLWLLLAAGAFVLTFLLLLALFDFERNWDWTTLHYNNLWSPSGVVRNLFYDGFRSVFPWAAFLLVGMAVGRLDLSDRRVKLRLLAGGLVVVAVVEVASTALVAHFTSQPVDGLTKGEVKVVFGTGSVPPLPLFLLSAGSTAMAVLGGCLLLTANKIVRAVAAPGRFALTWYLLHIFVGLGGVIAVGSAQACSPLQAAALGGLFWVGAVLTSTTYLRFFRVGPFEAMMRKVAG